MDNTNPPIRRNATHGWEPPEKILDYALKFEALVVQPERGDHFWDDTEAWYAECWPWMGKARADGQLFISVYGQRMQIHKFAWLLWNGDIPNDQFPRPVACGLKNCVAPHHMQLLNRSGAVERKLSRDEEELIRFLYLDPDKPTQPWSHVRLAEKFGVSPSTIGRVLKVVDA